MYLRCSALVFSYVLANIETSDKRHGYQSVYKHIKNDDGELKLTPWKITYVPGYFIWFIFKTLIASGLYQIGHCIKNIQERTNANISGRWCST